MSHVFRDSYGVRNSVVCDSYTVRDSTVDVTGFFSGMELALFFFLKQRICMYETSHVFL